MFPSTRCFCLFHKLFAYYSKNTIFNDYKVGAKKEEKDQSRIILLLSSVEFSKNSTDDDQIIVVEIYIKLNMYN